MNTTRTAVAAAAIVGASIVGGAIGASLIGSASAQTTPTTPATQDLAASGNATKPHYNTEPVHEVRESAQREADEQSGKAGFGGGHSNTDPAHEAGESAQRQTDEAAHDGQVGSSTTPTTGG